MLKEEVVTALKTHPCYNNDAHKKFARIHLPVAPKCNIQCNYCNRRYNCTNESRPGVTSKVLSPTEAVNLVNDVKRRIPELRVVAIAGPGDALANEESFETISLIRENFPDVALCLSTNGLMLPKYATKLSELGVNFITVTVNASDPLISEKIYDYVIWNGEKLTGSIASKRLLQSQVDGISKCAELGMAVKVNTVLIPGYNDNHIPELVKMVKGLGAYIVNILPFIPVEGTKLFNVSAPTPEKRREIMSLCHSDIRMMRHCRQCRADAIGFLDSDRSIEFMRRKCCNSGIELRNYFGVKSICRDDKSRIVAIASESNNVVDCGFGSANMFRIYESVGDNVRFIKSIDVNTRGEVYGQPHIEHIKDVIGCLDECDVIIVKEIGPRPRNILESRGKKVFVMSGNIMDVIRRALSFDKTPYKPKSHARARSSEVDL
ncbi:MAG: nitrogenase cofactor biosynthesis protein NifB [archaeon]|nr:nitrogenase cofactor biosynthesis protein NifB [archaeon]